LLHINDRQHLDVQHYFDPSQQNKHLSFGVPHESSGKRERRAELGSPVPRATCRYQVTDEVARRLQRIFCAMGMVASRVWSAEKFWSDPHSRDYLLFYQYPAATVALASGPTLIADVTRVIARMMQAQALVTSEALLTGQHWRSLQGSPSRGAINW